MESWLIGSVRRALCAATHAAGAALAAVVLVACDRHDGAVPSREPQAAVAGDAKLAAAPLARFVKLEEVSEWNGKPWASIAEFNLLDSTGAVVDRKSWTVTADSAGANESAANAIDGSPNTWWHTRWEGVDPSPPPPHAFVVDLGRPVKVSGFRYLPRQDNLVNGTIAKYHFYVSEDGVNWGKPISGGDFAGMGAPALEKTVVFAEATPNHPPDLKPLAARSTPMGQVVAMQIAASDADNDLLSYASTGLPTGLSIGRTSGLVSGTPIVPGTYAVTVSVDDGKGPAASTAFDWVIEPVAIKDAALPASGEVRFVKLEEVSEIGGRAWGSIAEFNLIDASGANLPRTGWTASADSADMSDKAGNAIDGNPASFWHSQWDGAAPPPPHSFIVDVGHPVMVRGFRYLPRQDKLNNGMIAKFRFYVSVDGVHWSKPLIEGDFSLLGEPHAEKTVRLK